MASRTISRIVALTTVSLACTVVPAAQAAIVNVDLSGSTTGSLVNGVGASFAQTFVGQSVSGIGISGSPSNPLTLDGSAGSITVAFFNPGVSIASNSLLSQPGNAAPLSALLSSNADSLAFTSGSADGGTSFSVNFYSSTGALVDNRSVTTLAGYSLYSLTGLSAFAGFTIYDNNDSAGLRFQNFSYNSVASSPTPEPASWAMMLGGFGAIGGALRSRRKLAISFG